jgi:hypothetical protein
MALYAFTVFLSAVLLFQVQLIIAKYILPWFGGAANVWIACMLFFQVLLACGYAYSHAIVSRLSARRQCMVHVLLLVVSVGLLALQTLAWKVPLLPGATWKPTAGYIPAIQVLGLLTISVGMPFFSLSTTSSLLQAWFSRRFLNYSPYRLYALSNTGSLLGLLSYPFLVEPNFGLSLQSQSWSFLYVAFALCCGFVAWQSRQYKETGFRSNLNSYDSSTVSFKTEKPTWLQRLLWLTLAAAASTVLLATTNQVTEEIAVVPFFWVLPLGIYLLTFILCFSSPWFYFRPLFVATAGIIMLFVGRTILKMPAIAVSGAYDVGIIEQMSVYYFALFICCMLCHGELVRLKPGSKYLTQFYLIISIGGALGGVFVGLIAPYFFRVLWELYIGYFVCGCAVLIAALRERRSLLNIPGWGWGFRVPAVAMVIALGIGPFFLLIDRLPQNYRDVISAITTSFSFNENPAIGYPQERTVEIRRNFYGILRVVEVNLSDPKRDKYLLYHGQTVHGFQLQHDEISRRLPTTYYTKNSGIGLAIMNHPRYKSTNRHDNQMRVGVIGLGVGTLAAYGRDGDYYRIYEINPDVVELAATKDGYFSFVADCKADVNIILGDARVSLENEEPQGFDVLALDAFCGGTPPVHLLTKEVFNIYLRHIRDGGVIALHISNRYIDFEPVILKLAKKFNLSGVHIISDGDDYFSYESDWILLTKNEDFLCQEAVANSSIPLIIDKDLISIKIWTDDYSNLFQLLR